MCVAIAKAAGIIMEDEVLRQCYDANPDGCGFSFVTTDGEIKIYKSMSYDPFYTEYKKMEEENPQSPFLIHFRIKTHGTKDLFNCHPFRISEDMAFIHNGVISKVPDCPDKKMSDTQMFNELFLKQLPDGWFDSNAIQDLIEEYIGYSKLAVLNRRNGGEIRIYNEDRGTWKGDVWFSNTLWERTNRYNTHLDNCLQCNSNIKNNYYANRNDVSFCSYNCKEQYYKTNNSGVSYIYALCANCNQYGRVVCQSADGIELYCSHTCRDIATKGAEDTMREAAGIRECEWCGQDNDINEMLELDSFYSYLQTSHLCMDCAEEAIAANLLKETPEIRAILEEHHNKTVRGVA